MDDSDRTTVESLIRHLEQAPWRFNFFQAVYLLKWAASRSHGTSLARTADRHKPGSLEFLQIASMGLDSAPVAGVRVAAGKYVLLVRGFGLFGSNGSLPLWQTEFAVQQKLIWEDNRPQQIPDRLVPGEELHPFWTESGFGAFCHLLQNRFLEMLYQAWEYHHKAPALSDRAARDICVPIRRTFFAVTGLLPHLLVDQRVEPRALYEHPDSRQTESVSPYGRLAELVAFFSGRLSGQIRNPEGLRVILEHQFGVTAVIQEFLGCWSEIPSQNRWMLNNRQAPADPCPGAFGILGERFYERQMKYRIRLGPMPREKYLPFFDRSPERQALLDLVSIYVGPELGWEVQLVLERDAVTGFRLPADDPLPESVRLGQTSWLQPAWPAANGAFNVQVPKCDPADVIIEPEIEWN